MIITPDTRPLDLLKSDLVRSPGIHASDIFGDLFEKLEPKRYDFGDAPLNGPLMALGSAWENHLERLLHLNGIDAHRPDELLSPEGIAYSPDLFIFNGTNRVGEIKLTSMALDDILPVIETREDGSAVYGPTNTLPAKFDKFLCQLKLYCFWLSWPDAWLCITSIRKPYAPEFLPLNITFTAAELRNNYAMIMNHWKHMQKEGRA